MPNSTHETLSTHCRNAYMDRTILNNEQAAIVTASLSLELLTVLPLNSLLVFGIFKYKRLDSVTWQYGILFGITGCFLGLVVIPINIILFTLKRMERSCYFEYSAIFIGQTNCQFTVYIILLLAVHRYFMVVPHSKSRLAAIVNGEGSKNVLFLAFIISLLHGGASVDFFGTISTSIPNFLMKIIDTLLGLIIGTLYLRLYIRIKTHAKKVRVTFVDDEISLQRPRAITKPKHIKGTAVTISMVLLALAVCYVPFLIMDFWTSWYTFVKSKKAPKNIRFVYYLTYGSVFFTSIANAAIIVYRDRDLKTFFKTIVWDVQCLKNDAPSTHYLNG